MARAEMCVDASMSLPVIPAPARATAGAGSVVLDGGWVIVAPPALSGISGFLRRALERDSNLCLATR